MGCEKERLLEHLEEKENKTKKSKRGAPQEAASLSAPLEQASEVQWSRGGVPAAADPAAQVPAPGAAKRKLEEESGDGQDEKKIRK